MYLFSSFSVCPGNFKLHCLFLKRRDDIDLVRNCVFLNQLEFSKIACNLNKQEAVQILPKCISVYSAATEFLGTFPNTNFSKMFNEDFSLKSY
jgi:hypothetical protein